ncbi:MAG: hypothetical protein H7A52_06485 [Akkermansiaceae bacterium]|nr:hypothetical protein [Akkermansiaceae bacterium]
MNLARLAGGVISAGMLMFFAMPNAGFSQGTGKVSEKIPAGHATLELLKPALDKVLSPEGRFVLLPGSGEVMVIDFPDKVRAAREAVAALEIPPPRVALDFAFRTNVAPGMSKGQPVDSTGDFPFPTRYEPPRIVANGGNVFTVIPAHPAGFKRRNVGTTLESTPTLNPDGSVTLDVDAEHTEFEGFVNYGSGILAAGGSGTIPVLGQVANPRFFAPFVGEAGIKMPIFSTTRISTRVLVRPRVSGSRVRVDLMPQLEISLEAEPGAASKAVPLTKFRTTIDVPNGGQGRVAGFAGASAAFNRAFLGSKDDDQGTTAIDIRARIMPGKADEGGENPAN